MTIAQVFQPGSTPPAHEVESVARTTSLSVLVPVYNEEHHVFASLQRLKLLETSVHLDRVEIIIVDDCSTDGSVAVVERFLREETALGESKLQWTFVRHS